MRRYTYMKLNLNDVPRRGSDLDLLNVAGQEGWRLVCITSNSIAYMVRDSEEKAPAPTPAPKRQRAKAKEE